MTVWNGTRLLGLNDVNIHQINCEQQLLYLHGL